MTDIDQREQLYELNRLQGRPEPQVDEVAVVRELLGVTSASGPRLVGEPVNDRKAFSTMQARAALRGYQLVESHMERGGVEYIVSKDSLTRAFSTLTEVNAWLDRVVGR